MPLPTQVSVLAKRRANNWISGFGGAFAKIIFDRFWSWQSQFLGNIDLFVVEFAGLSNTDQVLSSAACTLYAWHFIKPTAVAVFAKGTDNATTCSTNGSQDISIKAIAIGEYTLLYAKGIALANGFTVRGNTTATGSTLSAAADQATGFAVFGS